MNQLIDLINRYATPAGYRVHPREWLMLLELDPDTAARTINHLAILAAADDALRIAGHGHAALAAAHAHNARTDDNGETGTASAPAALTGFTARMTSATDRAWTAWHQIFIPLLRDACVLTDTPPAPVPVLTGRRWTDTHLHLAGLNAAYRGQIAARRHHATAPIVRFTLDVCRRIAADIHAHDPPPPPRATTRRAGRRRPTRPRRRSQRPGCRVARQRHHPAARPRRVVGAGVPTVAVARRRRCRHRRTPTGRCVGTPLPVPSPRATHPCRRSRPDPHPCARNPSGRAPAWSAT